MGLGASGPEIKIPKKLLEMFDTERLLIRKMRLEDINSFHQYRKLPEICQYQGFDPMQEKEAAQFIENEKNKNWGELGQWIQLSIICKQNQEMIGDCGVHLDEKIGKTAQIGITIAPLYQNKGFAKEVFSLLITELFENKNVHRIMETVDDRNIPSIALLKSFHFRQEAHFIENYFDKDHWTNEMVFALLKKEWKKRKKTK